MATIDSDSGTGRAARRTVNHQLPLVPFIDFLICLVVFLLANLGFANFARLHSSALVPGKLSDVPEAERKRLHVELLDNRFHVSWRIGSAIVASNDLPLQAVIEGRGDRHWTAIGGRTGCTRIRATRPWTRPCCTSEIRPRTRT